MFRFCTASSMVVHSLATWSAFGCQQNVIAIFLFSGWLIYGIPLSTSIEVFLFYMWYKLIENFDLNFLFFTYAIAHVCSSVYNYFLMIEIIRTVCSIRPATHLWKSSISAPPCVFILKAPSEPDKYRVIHLKCPTPQNLTNKNS